LLGLLCLAAIVVWWTRRALHDPRPFDTGLAWDAGRLGWATGHPERLVTWNGMPFLAAGMAIVGRVLSRRHTGDLVTVVNLLIVTGGSTVLMRSLRPRLPVGWWWVLAFALVSFGPLMSTVWWKQFNIMALALAAGGVELIRRDRRSLGAFAIALSVSIKPLVFLLPLFMLVPLRTRRAAIEAIVWIVVLDVLAQALFAVRAGDLATLDPTIGPRNLVHKTSAAGNVFLCTGLNFSPTSLLCRLNGGFVHWTLQRVFVWGLIVLLGLWVAQVLRSRAALSWDSFAFVCAFSIMLSPLSWAHYQVMLLPLFVLTLVRLTEDGSLAGWVGLTVAFVLASLMWAPYGNLIDGLRGVPENPRTTSFLEVYGQLAQYVLVLTAALWYAQHGRQSDREAVSAETSAAVVQR
jgi:Glycosyltransferase family 87